MITARKMKFVLVTKRYKNLIRHMKGVLEGSFELTFQSNNFLLRAKYQRIRGIIGVHNIFVNPELR